MSFPALNGKRPSPPGRAFWCFCPDFSTVGALPALPETRSVRAEHTVRCGKLFQRGKRLLKFVQTNQTEIDYLANSLTNCARAVNFSAIFTKKFTLFIRLIVVIMNMEVWCSTPLSLFIAAACTAPGKEGWTVLHTPRRAGSAGTHIPTIFLKGVST